ncbi:hypothetical protein [Blastopirellula marina]|nr:hypothetical protein [Blastopirellula marina]
MYLTKIETRGIQWLLLVAMVIFVGCSTSRECCPVDARNLYCGVGEEAVRKTPCGPDYYNYGYRATCWQTFPEGWGMECAPLAPVTRELVNPPIQEMIPVLEEEG